MSCPECGTKDAGSAEGCVRCQAVQRSSSEAKRGGGQAQTPRRAAVFISTPPDRAGNPRAAIAATISFLFVLAAAGYLVYQMTRKPDLETTQIERAFDAIRGGDWAAYQMATVTRADIIHKQVNPKPSLLPNQGFALKVLKPEERKEQQKDFERAVAGGANQIDFRGSTFIRKGSLLYRDTFEFEGSVPIRVYSILIRKDGQEIDTATLQPHFELVEWKSAWRFSGLRFKR